MQSQIYYLEVDDEICFKAMDLSDDESVDCATPVAKPAPEAKLTPNSGMKRPALLSIDQNIMAVADSSRGTPQKPPKQLEMLLCEAPTEQAMSAAEEDTEGEGDFFEALEGPPSANDENTFDAPNNASKTPSKIPTKTPSKTPKSFLKKLLAWGSSSKYPPNTPVEKAAVDTTADRMVGEASADDLKPDYLVSPPRDTARTEDAPLVNRELLWSDDTVPDATEELCGERETKESVQCSAPVRGITEEDDSLGESKEECVLEEDIQLAFDQPAEQPSSQLSGDRECRRGSGIGLSLQVSMSHAESLLLGSDRRTSNELAMNYGSESEHLPVYSQAEMDSALENLRYELTAKLNVQSTVTTPATVFEEVPAATDPSGNKEVADDERLSALQAELDMQKLQSAALFHQIKTLNDELAQSEVKLEARTKELNAKHDAELSATIHLVEQTTRAPLEGELAAMRLQIQTATTAEKEAITKVAALSDELCQMQKNEAELIKSHKKNVSDEKAKIVAKAKKQFDEGNAKYKAVVDSAKDLSNRLQVAEGALEQMQKDVQEVRAENEAAHAALSAEQNKATVLAAGLRDCFIAALPDAAQKGTLECAQDIAKSLLEQRGALVASTALVAELESQIIAEVQQREQLQSALKAAEVLLAANIQELEKVKRGMESENGKNMALYGKMAVDKKAVEERLEVATQELAASNERCVSLRAMNEELLQMLEQNVPTEP